MKMEFEHRTINRWPGEYVETTLTVRAEYGYSLEAKANCNINLEALARDSNKRQIRKTLYEDLESEWIGVSKAIDEVLLDSAQVITPGTKAVVDRVEAFGALLRSKLEPGG